MGCWLLQVDDIYPLNYPWREAYSLDCLRNGNRQIYADSVFLLLQLLNYCIKKSRKSLLSQKTRNYSLSLEMINGSWEEADVFTVCEKKQRDESLRGLS